MAFSVFFFMNESLVCENIDCSRIFVFLAEEAISYPTDKILKCHSEQMRCMWENNRRVRRICDEVAFPIFLRWCVLYFPIEVCCCRFTAKILRLFLCAPFKIRRLRMTENNIGEKYGKYQIKYASKHNKNLYSVLKKQNNYDIILMSHHLNNEINLHGRTMPFSQPYYISVEIRYRNNRLRKVGYRWCDNYARGILRCHLARGGTLFF